MRLTRCWCRRFHTDAFEFHTRAQRKLRQFTFDFDVGKAGLLKQFANILFCCEEERHPATLSVPCLLKSRRKQGIDFRSQFFSPPQSFRQSRSVDGVKEEFSAGFEPT